MYKHFGTYSSTKVCTISIECIALVDWAKLISLSSWFVNHYCCTAWTVKWLTRCAQRFYFYQKRMFYKLYSAWVQNSSVITKLYVYRNPVGVQICTLFHFPLSVKSKNENICGLCLRFARAILQKKLCEAFNFSRKVPGTCVFSLPQCS